MVLYGIYSIVLCGIEWYFVVLYGIAWYSVVAWYCMLLHGTVCILRSTVWLCMVIYVEGYTRLWMVIDGYEWL